MTTFDIKALEKCFKQPKIKSSFESLYHCLGFITATSSSPDVIQPSEWMEQLVKAENKVPEFDSEEQVKTMTRKKTRERRRRTEAAVAAAAASRQSRNGVLMRLRPRQQRQRQQRQRQQRLGRPPGTGAKNATLFLNFTYVCPEPVLAK